jgi:hypothetical protein
MRAVKIAAAVSKDHTLYLELPEEIGEGPAEVIVLVRDSAEQAEAQSDGWSLDEFLAESRLDPRFTRSKEEIDAHVRAERQAWE